MIFKLIGLFLISVTGGLVGINASLRLKSRTEFLEIRSLYPILEQILDREILMVRLAT